MNRFLSALLALALGACVTPVTIHSEGAVKRTFRLGGVKIATDARAATSVATTGAGLVHGCGVTVIGAQATWCLILPAPQPTQTKGQ